MISYYARIPAAAQRRLFDGHTYGIAYERMNQGRIETTCDEHMYRVAFVTNGEAYLLLGRAGDAIAQIVNLPFGVSAFRDGKPIAQIQETQQ